MLTHSSPFARFVTCPVCGGHEALSSEAVSELLSLLESWLRDNPHPGVPVYGAIINIRNRILNAQERTLPKTLDPLLD